MIKSGKGFAIFYRGRLSGEEKTTTPDKAMGTERFFVDTQRFIDSTGKGFCDTVITPVWDTENSLAIAYDFIKSKDETEDGIKILVLPRTMLLPPIAYNSSLHVPGL